MPKGIRRRRRPRDPAKPKRGKSSFLLFTQYTRPAVVKEMPHLSFPEVAREVARRWKIVDPAEKEELEKRAAVDRARYAEEMKTYEAPPDLDDDGRRRRRKQNKEGPKRNVSSFMWFCKKHRSLAKGSNPDSSMTDISTILGKQWNSMTAADRLPFESLAAQDKERYLRESKAYQETKAKAMAELAAKQAQEDESEGFTEDDAVPAGYAAPHAIHDVSYEPAGVPAGVAPQGLW